MTGNYKHLFFDLDNTILDFDYASHRSFEQLLIQFEYVHENAYEVYKIINSRVWGEFERGEITAVELRARRFNLFLEKMEWKGDGLKWNKTYLENLITYTKFVDGAQSLIENLSKKYKIHIVTNGLKEVQRPRIHTADLNKYISSVTVSDEIGSAKPQSDFFKIALLNAGNPEIEEILMIGDNYSSDIEGASNYGLRSCWFNYKKIVTDKNLHTFEINHLEEILHFIS